MTTKTRASKATTVKEATTKASAASVSATPETVEATASPELTVQDLQNLRAIIDVASQRGAFKPTEMVTVGNTYNRLDTFLTAISAANASKEETVKE